MGKQAIIIGAGPAGLTAAYELLKRTDIKPVILEKSGDIGGISKTINYKGNRMDIGGHRFFSKSDRVMNWWLNIMPLEKTNEENITINYQNKKRSINSDFNQATAEAANPGLVMLLRKRLSRIYFLRKFFNYPIQLSADTLRKLGIIRTIRILLSYLVAQVAPRKKEKSLEDFLINRFGRELYQLFFKDYTEKVWGVPCNEISAEWGAQRIKGVSITKAIKHAAQMLVKKKNKSSSDITQKNIETSLIEQFLYPSLGPGQLWEEVARQIEVLGGTILMHQDVKSIELEEGMVKSVTAVNSKTGVERKFQGDYFFSTMPVQELIAGMKGVVPNDVQEIAAGLQYRDFITVGILLEKLSSAENQTLDLKDTWIYIQERDVKVGRLQLFNNWSPYMVNKPDTVWIGMEYFCNEGDDFWSLSDDEIKRTAIAELEKMGLAQTEHVLDSTVHRVEKTYPAYFGTYNRFDQLRSFIDGFENLFLVGRNGMHKYNNADHSMLTAMTAIDNICAGVTEKNNIWAINTEQDYHEEKMTANQSNASFKIPNDSAAKNSTVSKTELGGLLTFKEYLFLNGRNTVYLLCAAVAILIQFCVFKYFYPFAGFINADSYVYLETGYHNLSINTYPVGYSNFLRLLSVFTKSDTVLIALQYVILQVSLLFFLFTLFYYYKPANLVRIFLLCFCVLNPAFLYLCNYVSSDSLFLSLSLGWFTTLLWILHKPTQKILIIHAVILFLCFTVRYNALYYPLISCFVLTVSKQRFQFKASGIIAVLTPILLFIIHTGNKNQQLTGTWQFSPFSGWQLANNALYAYRYVAKDDRKPVPPKLRQLDNEVRTYFDTTRNISRHPQELILASTIYMWDPVSPLQHFMKARFKNDTTTEVLKKWSTMGPLYKEYGNYLITQYPFIFFKYYIYPNALKYYTPPIEFLGSYSTGVDSIPLIAQTWFGYKTKKLQTRLSDFKVHILDFYPVLSGIVNTVFLFVILGFVLLKCSNKSPLQGKAAMLAVAFWIINFCFSVFASPIALRFQLLSITISFAFGCLLLECILMTVENRELESVLKKGQFPITS